jgi:hypothetical protein
MSDDLIGGEEATEPSVNTQATTMPPDRQSSHDYSRQTYTDNTSRMTIMSADSQLVGALA